MVLSTVCSARPVRVIHLCMFVQCIPFALPAPHGTAVDSALSRNYQQWQLVFDQQPHSRCSRFREVRVGRIGHSRPPFCNCLVVITVYGACFYVAKVVDEYVNIDKNA